MQKVNLASCLLLSLFIMTGQPLAAANKSAATAALLLEYQLDAGSSFSDQAGKTLWTQVSKGRSCTSCHLSSVTKTGKHQKTGKLIQPMSPTVNPERLTDIKKIRKWLLRNCKWTFRRECTSLEKGNLLLWLSQQ